MNALIKSDLLEPGNGADLKAVVNIAKSLVPRHIGTFHTFDVSHSGDNEPGILEVKSSFGGEVLLSVVATSGEKHSVTFRNSTEDEALAIVLAVAEEL